MVRVKNWELILDLMNGKHENLRNIGIIAHIDHGKTTLSDILLAKTGLISKSIAGEARVLDYLEEEQKRGITIKSANISLLYNNHIINLIDTPGHVDFSGKVRRALRIIDSVIVVVDAVEGCMVMTEVLTRLAMSEVIMPILFINKIDRLIRELKLNEDKIQKRLEYIIQMFNKILINILPEKYYEKWKIIPQNNNVIFGSALHHWGFTYSQLTRSGKNFDDIINLYKQSNHITEVKRIGYEMFPLDKAVLNTIIDITPDPKTAQKYRMINIWKGDLNSKIGQDLINCSRSSITLIGITKVINDVHTGTISIGRIFSGTVNMGDKYFLLNKKKEFRLLNLYIYMGASKHTIKELKAGNIIGITGNIEVPVGETLIDIKHKDIGIPFEKMSYTQEPIITISIEAYHPRELNEMIKILGQLKRVDPNLEVSINEETGEYLISGTGELQLELFIKMIEKLGVKVITSKPIVIYLESINKKSKIIEFNSNDNSLYLKYQINTLDSKTLELLQKKVLNNELSKEETSSILIKESGQFWTKSEGDSIVSIIDKNNIIIDKSNYYTGPAINKYGKENNFLTALFISLLKKGPLINENIFGLRIILHEYKIQDHLFNLGPIMVIEELRNEFYNYYKKLDPIILEPIYKIQITTPLDYIGKSTNLIESKRGKIEEIKSDNTYSYITGYIPVSETFGLADEIRTKTSGWAFWQTVFSHWARISDKKLKTLMSK